MRIAVLPGDGIGPEVVAQGVKVLKALAAQGLPIVLTEGALGGAAYDAHGDPLPAATLALVRDSDAILFGAEGGFQYESLPRGKRPGDGLLRLRRELNLYANFRPAVLFPELIGASPLRPELVSGLDLIILRELVGDIYFGEPRGSAVAADGERSAFNTMCYTEGEVARIAHVAFRTAMTRRRKLCSVDKANVLETSELWRTVIDEVAREYKEVRLSHLYVDAAAMALLRDPKQFDVIVTGNLFGDILSDEAAMLAGSIGMLPSASLGDGTLGLYEPVHGCAPDIAGQDVANPLATILSIALMMRYSFRREDLAARIETAVRSVLAAGYRTADIAEPGTRQIGTNAMGDAVAAALAR
jgi:3-isopropylmalate dehydrogenase